MQKILIVEDEEILRNAYVSIFSMEGFAVAEAANGKQAVQEIERFQPDLVVLDVMMPVMSGIEFLEEINLHSKYPGTKVLVLSNLSDKSTVDQVMSLGATRHMVKASVSPGQLVAAVRTLLKDT